MVPVAIVGFVAFEVRGYVGAAAALVDCIRGVRAERTRAIDDPAGEIRREYRGRRDTFLDPGLEVGHRVERAGPLLPVPPGAMNSR